MASPCFLPPPATTKKRHCDSDDPDDPAPAVKRLRVGESICELFKKGQVDEIFTRGWRYEDLVEGMADLSRESPLALRVHCWAAVTILGEHFCSFCDKLARLPDDQIAKARIGADLLRRLSPKGTEKLKENARRSMKMALDLIMRPKESQEARRFQFAYRTLFLCEQVLSRDEFCKVIGECQSIPDYWNDKRWTWTSQCVDYLRQTRDLPV